MNKSKFKSVKFKPFDLELYNFKDQFWTAVYAFGGATQNTIRFTDSCIEAYPELFEVEKAEREFEDGAWYKLHSHKYKHGYTLGYYYELLNCFYIVGTNVPHYLKDFDKIGEKIEL